MKYKIRLTTNSRKRTEPGFFFNRGEFDSIVYRSVNLSENDQSCAVDFIITAEKGTSGKTYYNQSSNGDYFSDHIKGEPVVLSSIDNYSFVTGLDKLWNDIVDQWNSGVFDGKISEDYVSSILLSGFSFPLTEGSMIKLSPNPDPILCATTRLRWIVINHSPVLHQWFSDNQGGGKWVSIEFGGQEAP